MWIQINELGGEQIYMTLSTTTTITAIARKRKNRKQQKQFIIVNMAMFQL